MARKKVACQTKPRTDIGPQKVGEEQGPQLEVDTGRASRVCAGVLLGNVMHNLADGFFIAAIE